MSGGWTYLSGPAGLGGRGEGGGGREGGGKASSPLGEVEKFLMKKSESCLTDVGFALTSKPARTKLLETA